jgi:hypothetical protein
MDLLLMPEEGCLLAAIFVPLLLIQEHDVLIDLVDLVLAVQWMEALGHEVIALLDEMVVLIMEVPFVLMEVTLLLAAATKMLERKLAVP